MKKKVLILSTVLLFTLALFAPFASLACDPDPCRWDYTAENCRKIGGPECAGTSWIGSAYSGHSMIWIGCSYNYEQIP